ncbi:MAG: MFS transporter [Patescibacteria group bacterium]|jgi:MFS family permease|nr:MFS transporter [Patescibacteria group bacterium]
MKKFKKLDNVALFTLFDIFIDPLFWGPIIISYIINVGGMTLSELYFMESIVLGYLVIIEIYSSAWADLLGRKNVIILGSAIAVAGITYFSFADCPLDIWIANILAMTSFALISGTNVALLADSMKEEGNYDQYLKVVSKARSRRHFVVMFTSILSGYMYAINPRLPMFISIPGVIFSLFVAFFFKETKRKSSASEKEKANHIKFSILFLANHKKLKWIVGFFVLMYVVTKIWFFTVNPYFELVELSPKYYGWVFFFMNFIAWIITKNSHKIKEKIGEFRVLGTIVLFMSLPLIFMGILTSNIAISFLAFSSFLRGITGTIASEMKNKYLKPENRATVLSLISSLSAVAGMISLFIFGLILDHVSLEDSMIGLGIIALIVGIFSLSKYKKIFT